MTYHRPAQLPGNTIRIKLGDYTVYLIVNCDQFGPVEVFCKVGKAGEDTHASSEAIGKLVSRALRGADTAKARKEIIKSLKMDLRGIQGKSYSHNEGIHLLSIPDAIGWVLLGCPDNEGKMTKPEVVAPVEAESGE